MQDLSRFLLDNYATIMYILAADVLIGGVIGFVVGKSRPSLIAGVTSGILLALAAYLFAGGNKIGLYLGLVVSIALTGFFFSRYAQTRKPFPGLIMGMTCLLAAIANVMVLIAWG